MGAWFDEKNARGVAGTAKSIACEGFANCSGTRAHRAAPSQPVREECKTIAYKKIDRKRIVPFILQS
jgi:hypothetical protein